MINSIKTLSGFLLVLALISWKADKTGPWITTKGKQVTLHTRPVNHSKSTSPDSLAIRLLYSDSIPERAFYPQIGCLVNWLFDTYGVEKINRLYTVKSKNIEEKFLEVTGESFADMERKYMDYRATNGH